MTGVSLKIFISLNEPIDFLTPSESSPCLPQAGLPVAGRSEIMGSIQNSGKFSKVLSEFPHFLPTQRGVGSSTPLKTKFQIY